jgi:hypothetical protein
VGWVDGRDHNALRSSDGGLTWAGDPTGYDRSMRAVCYQEGLLIATGLGGLLFKAEEDPTRAPTPMRPIALMQNSPNPFNPRTSIPFVLDRSSEVSLVVYDIAGRAVRTLLQETRAEGRYEVIWHGRDDRGRHVASGIYLYTLTAGLHSETRRMVLVR